MLGMSILIVVLVSLVVIRSVILFSILRCIRSSVILSIERSTSRVETFSVRVVYMIAVPLHGITRLFEGGRLSIW